jgi:hypothetical protein
MGDEAILCLPFLYGESLMKYPEAHENDVRGGVGREHHRLRTVREGLFGVGAAGCNAAGGRRRGPYCSPPHPILVYTANPSTQLSKV